MCLEGCLVGVVSREVDDSVDEGWFFELMERWEVCIYLYLFGV